MIYLLLEHFNGQTIDVATFTSLTACISQAIVLDAIADGLSAFTCKPKG